MNERTNCTRRSPHSWRRCTLSPPPLSHRALPPPAFSFDPFLYSAARPTAPSFFLHGSRLSFAWLSPLTCASKFPPRRTFVAPPPVHTLSAPQTTLVSHRRSPSALVPRTEPRAISAATSVHARTRPNPLARISWCYTSHSPAFSSRPRRSAGAGSITHAARSRCRRQPRLHSVQCALALTNTYSTGTSPRGFLR